MYCSYYRYVSVVCYGIEVVQKLYRNQNELKVSHGTKVTMGNLYMWLKFFYLFCSVQERVTVLYPSYISSYKVINDRFRPETSLMNTFDPVSALSEA